MSENIKGWVSVSAAVRSTGYTKGLYEALIHEGKITFENGKISQDDIDRILDEKRKFISLYEYAILNTSGRFNGNFVRDRNKLLDILEINNFFGIQIIEIEDTLVGTERDVLYFPRDDIPVLDQNLVNFFGLFSLSESDKVSQLINNSVEHKNTKQYLEKFIHDVMFEKEMTPSFTDFVRKILRSSDVFMLTDEEITNILKDEMTFETKTFILRWLDFVKKYHKVEYNIIKPKIKESKSLPAYSADTYFDLARCFFNAEYIDKQDMIRKALDNHKYAEMWLYLTLFFACGWRAGDVTEGWRYLRLSEHPEGCMGINKETLYDDLLNDRIPDETYEEVSKYAIGCIEISGQLPSKNSDVIDHPLLAVVTKELYAFYGLLTLIAESHMLRSNEGYMKKNRTTEYQNRMNLRAFFGSRIQEILHNRNIRSSRLNKDYLQGTEDEGRKAGYGGIMTSALASYARNHANYDTIKIYLKDHNFTAETADVVIYFMAQRGVFGFELYQTLLTAYPDIMNKLTLKEQNEIIEQMRVSPLMIEQTQSGVLASDVIKECFLDGHEDAVFNMLKAMYEISQTKGKGKDKGIYCMKRVTGHVCPYPGWKSCIANACQYLVFSKYGYIPLLEVLKDFKIKANAGDKKAEIVLKQILKPRYQKIYSKMIEEFHLNTEERNGLRMLAMEVDNE